MEHAMTSEALTIVPTPLPAILAAAQLAGIQHGAYISDETTLGSISDAANRYADFAGGLVSPSVRALMRDHFRTGVRIGWKSGAGEVDRVAIATTCQRHFAAELAHALEHAAAFVELSTGNGCRRNPDDWPRKPNGDPDAEAIVRRCRAVLAQVTP